MIGHKGHPEVEGTMGQLTERHPPGRGRRGRGQRRGRATAEKLAVVTQTTLSVDDAAEIIAAAASALSRRARAQAAGHLLRHAEPAGRREDAGAAGRRGDRGRQPDQLQQQPPARARRAPGRRKLHGRLRRRTRPEWFEGKTRVGLTAGASAPEVLVDEVIDRVKRWARCRCARWTACTRTWCFRCPRASAT